MKIPGVIFIIIGSLVSYFSHRVGPKMVVFFWIGVVFIGYGIFDTLVHFILKDKMSKTTKKKVNPPFKVVVCPQCRTRVYAQANYCYNCGTRTRQVQRQ